MRLKVEWRRPQIFLFFAGQLRNSIGNQEMFFAVNLMLSTMIEPNTACKWPFFP